MIYNILNESLLKEVKKLKKQYKVNDDFKAFSEALRRELHWSYWAKAEWELTITKDEDDRIILCDLFENTYLEDVTDDTTFDWCGFYEYLSDKRISHNNYIKFDVYDQIMYRWDDFVDFLWKTKLPYERV